MARTHCVMTDEATRNFGAPAHFESICRTNAVLAKQLATESTLPRASLRTVACYWPCSNRWPRRELRRLNAQHNTPAPAHEHACLLVTLLRTRAGPPSGADSLCCCREVLRTFAEGERSRNEGCLASARRSTRGGPRGALFKAFTALRQEYVSLGYAVYPEVSLPRASRSDM